MIDNDTECMTAMAQIRTMILHAIKQRDTELYDHLLPGAVGSVWDIKEATRRLCEMIELRSVDVYAEVTDHEYRWMAVENGNPINYATVRTTDKSLYDLTTSILKSILVWAGDEFGLIQILASEPVSVYVRNLRGTGTDIEQLIDTSNVVFIKASVSKLLDELVKEWYDG